MIHFQFLSGTQAGQRWLARRFPVRIGRAADNDLQVADDGVWDWHCELRLTPGEGFLLIAREGALVSINHQPSETTRLRNGDVLELGALRLQFWLADPAQRSLQVQEWLLWTVLLAVGAGQVGLLLWLLQ